MHVSVANVGNNCALPSTKNIGVFCDLRLIYENVHPLSKFSMLSLSLLNSKEFKEFSWKLEM